MKQFNFYWHLLKRDIKMSQKRKTQRAILVAYILLFSLMLPTAVIGFMGNREVPSSDFTLNWERKEEPQPLSVEEQIRQIATEADFQWIDYLVRLAHCESRLDPLALNNNGQYGIDRGLFQINSKYHPEVNNACAFDIVCATKWTMDRINNGHQKEWACNKIILNK